MIVGKHRFCRCDDQSKTLLVAEIDGEVCFKEIPLPYPEGHPFWYRDARDPLVLGLVESVFTEIKQ